MAEAHLGKWKKYAEPARLQTGLTRSSLIEDNRFSASNRAFCQIRSLESAAMRGGLDIERYVRRTHLAEELAAFSREAGSEQDVADCVALIEELLELRDLAQKTTAALLEKLYSEEHAKHMGRAEELVRKTLRRSNEVFGEFKEHLVAERPGKSVPPTLLDAFIQAAHDMQECERQLAEAVPDFNPDITRQALAEAQAGAGEFAEDILARLQGENSAGG